MSGSRTLIIIGFVIVALAVGVGGFVLYRNMRQGQATPTPPPEQYVPEAGDEGMQAIVVAAQNIPRGTRITEDNNAVKTATWPQGSVPEGVLTDVESAYGRIARVDIVLDMPITEGMLVEKGSDLASAGSDAALQIPSGRVAYALPVARWSSVAWAIQPGDHVDLLISLLIVDLDEEFQTELPNSAIVCSTDEEGNETCQEGLLGRLEPLPTGEIANVVPSEYQQRPRLVTQLTVQDAIVLRVGDWVEEEEEEAAPPPPEEEPPAEGEATPTPTPLPPMAESLTLAVTPQDAVVLKYLEEAGASMDLVLRSADDAGVTVVTEQVTLDYLFQRFAMEAPPKLPYGYTPSVTRLRRSSLSDLYLMLDLMEGWADRVVENAGEPSTEY